MRRAEIAWLILASWSQSGRRLIRLVCLEVADPEESGFFGRKTS
jgi:hypothetical protein